MLLVVLGAGGYAAWYVASPLDAKLPAEVEIPPGAGFRAAVGQLERAGLKVRPYHFEALARVLRRAYRAMQRHLQTEWDARTPNVPYRTPYEALIMASIIEKETGRAAERDQIGGVLVNRLRIGMRLQVDPTVIYGLGATFDGNLKKIHLLEDGPYNTYTRAGLPPTPIAMPGLPSLRSAVRPGKTDALYYVSRGDGTSQFSRSIQEHNRAVTKYQLRGGR